MASLRKKISTKFKNRYRLIVRRDEDLEERVSIVLTPLNTVLVLSALLFMFGTLIFVLMAYTPLSSILPTTATSFSNKDRLDLIQKVDSLEALSAQRDFQEQMLKNILQGGDGDVDEPINESSGTSSTPVDVVPGSSSTKLVPVPSNYTFYTPISGKVSDTFNIERNHFAVDIAAKRRDIVKAAQKGTVIFSAWNPESGYTLVIQHPNDFLSVYKHNAVLLKKEGNFVSAGDAIALVGSTGELTSGPHLHFELWNRGVALNPQKYISF